MGIHADYYHDMQNENIIELVLADYIFRASTLPSYYTSNPMCEPNLLTPFTLNPFTFHIIIIITNVCKFQRSLTTAPLNVFQIYKHF